MNIRPLADRVVIKQLDAEDEQTRGGIIIPDTAKEKPQEGEVLEVGPGRKTEDGKLIELEVKKGDRVLYGKYAGTEFRLGEEELMILRETDILAIVN